MVAREMFDWELRATRRRGRARDWALVLAAVGIESLVERRGGAFAVCVRPDDAERAAAALEAYERENAAPRGRHRAAAREVEGLAPLNAALAAVFALLVFHAVTGPRDPEVVWFARGSAEAARILAGEGWRAVTALTLHADFTHVAANALFGTLFLAAAGRSLGPGLTLALAVLAGALGNLANAWLRGPPHVSVGASTAVFAAVGVLAGWRIFHRPRGRRLAQRVGIPIAAALGVLAMLGTGDAPTDVWAHLLGLAAGVPVGAAAGALLAHPPRWPVQAAWAVAAVAVVLGCWLRALG